MKADFSRLTFDALKHYAGVLHQQGRVWLDADWNEEVLSRLHLLQQETFDMIGACGVPAPHTAFKISPNPDPNAALDDFVIAGGPEARGRYYVQGIMCQLDQDTTYLTQPDFPDPPRIVLPQEDQSLTAIIYLEVWRRLITYLEDDDIREIALNGPDTATRLKTIAQVKVHTLPSSGRRTPTCANADQFLPPFGSGTLTTLQPTDVLPDDLCRLPDPANYTGRENRLYRVQIHDGGDVLDGSNGSALRAQLANPANAGSLTITLTQALSKEQAAALKRSGVVQISNTDGQSEAVPVTEASATTINLARGLNRSYAAGSTITGGVARFKWSRDNAAFAVRVTAISPDRRTLTLASLGRDQATALRQGDIVEINDDASELGPARGHLTHLIADPDPDQFTVSLSEPLPERFGGGPSSPPTPPPPDLRHLTLRRWDGLGWTQATFSETDTPDMNLGDGVHINFGGSDLHPGDYWQFTARSADGSVELLADEPPHGIKRYRCPLAIVRWSRERRFPLQIVAVAFRQVDANQEQIQRVNEVLEQFAARGQDTMTADEVRQLAQEIGFGDERIETLLQLLERLASEQPHRLRMTVVSDCRKRFDPLTEQREGMCDCTVTVAPGESIQAAIDQVGEEGGTVCLLPGTHTLEDTITVEEKHHLTIRGAGAATIVDAPALPIAMLFQNCMNLTLTDFAVVNGQIVEEEEQPDQPPGEGPVVNRPVGVVAASPPIVPRVLQPTSGMLAALSPQQLGFAGALTFVSCVGVRVTGCRVTCRTLAERERLRTCISFLGRSLRPQPEQPTEPAEPVRPEQPVEPAEPVIRPDRPIVANTTINLIANLSNRIERLREILESGAGRESARPTITSSATTTAAPFRRLLNARTAAFAEAVRRLPRPTDRSTDITLRDCRLFADAGQSGLLLADCRVASIENTWMMATALLPLLGIEPGRVADARGRLGRLGVVLLANELVTFTDNLILGFETALHSNSQNTMLSGNLSGVCQQGIITSGSSELLLSDNLVSADSGPALQTTGDFGEILVHGNRLFGNTRSQEQPGTTVDIRAQTALLVGNSFRSGGTLQPLVAVGVHAQQITYSTNRSVCENLPVKTNVFLLARSDDERPGTVSAFGNTCIEPPTDEAREIRGRLRNLEREHEELIQKFIDPATDQPSQEDLLRRLAELEKAWLDRERVLEITGREFFRTSLMAVGGVAVTGLNILSYHLRRSGRGSDQGSVENAF